MRKDLTRNSKRVEMDEFQYMHWLEDTGRKQLPNLPTKEERLQAVDKRIVAFLTSPAFACVQEDARLPAASDDEVAGRWRSTLDILDSLFDKRYHSVN